MTGFILLIPATVLTNQSGGVHIALDKSKKAQEHRCTEGEKHLAWRLRSHVAGIAGIGLSRLGLEPGVLGIDCRGSFRAGTERQQAKESIHVFFQDLQKKREFRTAGATKRVPSEEGKEAKKPETGSRLSRVFQTERSDQAWFRAPVTPLSNACLQGLNGRHPSEFQAARSREGVRE